MQQTRRIDVGPVTLTIAEAGPGGRPLFLVHGFTGAGEDFEAHLDDLAEAGWHVVAPDQRGHGGSGKPEEESDYSLDLFATDLLALADALGWERFTLLGHSMGGMVAQVVALRAPERLDGLVLMDTGHGPVAVDPELAATGAAIARDAGMGVLADAMAAQPSPLETPAAAKLREDRPDLVARWDARFRTTSPAMYASMITAMLGQDDRLERLRAVEVPTLVIVGEQDSPFVGPSRRMAEAIPGARLEVLPDAGHSPQSETPEAWSKALRAFLASSSASSSASASASSSAGH